MPAAVARAILGITSPTGRTQGRSPRTGPVLELRRLKTQRVAVVTDSLACLTQETISRHRLGVLPIYLYFEGKAYRDGVDVTPAQAYEIFQKNPKQFNTSAPSPGDCLAKFRELAGQAGAILCVTVSVRLSAVYNSAKIAREQFIQESPGVPIELMDSNTATASEGFVALAAARAAEEGKGLDEVARVARTVRDRVNMLMLLDTIRYVYRSGRIPRMASGIGSALNLRPILTVSGAVRFVGMVTSREQGISRLLRAMRLRLGQKPARIAVMHAYAPDAAVRLKERISGEFNCRELCLTEVSPVIGYATGTGTLGVAFYLDQEP